MVDLRCNRLAARHEGECEARYLHRTRVQSRAGVPGQELIRRPLLTVISIQSTCPRSDRKSLARSAPDLTFAWAPLPRFKCQI